MSKASDQISANLAAVRTAIHQAAEQAGRSPEEITLCAVTKTFPVEDIQLALAAGVTVCGENRVQELLAKAPLLPTTTEWHLIGHLQSNKVRKALSVAHTIQSIDSLQLATQVSRVAGEMERSVRLLLQVNIAQDHAKFGWTTADLTQALPELLQLPHVHIDGLMTIPELAETAEEARPHFANLRQLREQLQQRFQHPLPHLSMGMSGDFPAAIAEGATMVRVGSRIFGGRS